MQFILRAIKSLCNNAIATATLKILVSSRPKYDMQEEFKDKPPLCLQTRHVHYDVETYIQSEVMKRPRLRCVPQEARQSLVSSIVERAERSLASFIQRVVVLSLISFWDHEIASNYALRGKAGREQYCNRMAEKFL
jgi:hypothetical protein